MPSIPGAVHPFLLATSFFTLSKVTVKSLTLYFLMKLSSYFLHPWHIRCSFFSLPYTTPEIHEFVHFWHLPFSCPIFFQCPGESFLVALEPDIILLFFSCPIFFQCLGESFLVALEPDIILFFSRVPFSSNVWENLFWSRWNLILSCFLLLFSVYFANFTFLYLIWSSHISRTFLKLELVISF